MLDLDLTTHHEGGALVRRRHDLVGSMPLPTTPISMRVDDDRVQLGTLVEAALDRLPCARPSRRLGRLLCGAILGLMGTAAVASPSPDLGECTVIQSDQARLECYDRVAGRAPAASTQPLAQSVERTAMAAPAAPNTGVVRAATDDASPSLIQRAWALTPDSERYAIGFYQPNYLLVANYTDRINKRPFSPLFSALEVEEQDLDQTEARFQLSFKFRVLATDDHRWGVWAAYSQKSQWQIYNDRISRPFRDTNYMPELMVSFDPDLRLGDLEWHLLSVGYNHQSNGRSDPISRSWDRLIATIGVEQGNLALILRSWIRIDDEDADDDNPDITDYYGYGDLTAIYKWREHSFSLMGRGNPNTGKGTAELTWMSPRLLGPLRAYVRGSTGYGDTMLDYNWNQSAIGIGLALNDLL